jgi:hypothetical protein
LPPIVAQQTTITKHNFTLDAARAAPQGGQVHFADRVYLQDIIGIAIVVHSMLYSAEMY